MKYDLNWLSLQALFFGKRIYVFALVVVMVLAQDLYANESCQDLFSIKPVAGKFWGAQFLDAYTGFDFNDHPMTIGIEVEGVVGRKIGRNGLATLVASELAAVYPNQQVTLDRGVVQYYRNGDLYRYWIADDSTIQNRTGEESVEIIAPILRNEEDLQVFFRVLDKLKVEGGMRADPTSAGVHVHVGFPEARPAEIGLLALIFAMIEKDTFKSFSVVKSRQNQWAQLTSQDLKVLFHLKNIDGLKVESFLGDNEDARFHGLNFWSLKKYGTVEFRLFNSSVNKDEIDLMVKFSTALVKAVREKDQRLVHLLEEHSLDRVATFSELSKSLGFDLPDSEAILSHIHVDAQQAVWKKRAASSAAYLFVLGFGAAFVYLAM